MTCLYGGFAVVVVAIFLMKGPDEIWHEKQPPVSPAVSCTVINASQFFFVYLLVAIAKTSVEIRGPSLFLTKLQGLLTLAKYTVNFAPMLCVLFIAARMR